MDPSGSDNITEINASTQPGWTPGFVNVVFNSGTCSALGGTEAPPASILGDLDPPLTNVDLSGTIKASDGMDICAMALANGQFMFSCDGSGSYALNIPLDINGQFKLQVYADGFAPTIQFFDEFSLTNDVRMARASECQ